MTSQVDKLTYFALRARAEGIRMLYAAAGVPLDDCRITGEQFGQMKKDLPLAQVPILTTSEGTLCNSNSIIRYAGNKLGLVGSTPWQQAQHDVVVEMVISCMDKYAIPNIYKWLFFKQVPEPENKDEILEAAKQKWVMTLKAIQAIAEKCGQKFIVGDQIGVAECFLYAGMEFCKVGTPDVMTLTPWVEDFAKKFEADEKMKAYMAARPDEPI